MRYRIDYFTETLIIGIDGEIEVEAHKKMKRVLSLLLISILFMGTPLITHAEETNVQEKIIYNMVIDRFNNGTLEVGEGVDVDDPYAYNGGDLRGIIKKLDQISELGFNAIHLSPLMENADNGFHGYWITDMYEVEPLFGTKEDLEELIEEAHKRDIDIYMEFVFNYVSSDHPIVNDSTKENWVKEVKAEQTDATFWLEDVKQLQLNEPDVQAEMMDVADYWMEEVDIDGFVLHAADQADPEFMEDFTAHVKDRSPEFVLIADILEEDAAIEPFIQNDAIDAVQNYKVYEKMNEVFAQVNRPMSDLDDVWNEAYEDKSLLFVDTKNTPRFSYVTAEQSRSALTTWKLALTYMYTMPGTPSLLQGSELPMYGPTFLESQYLVPFNSTDPDLEEFHDRISSLRNQLPVLQDGDYEQIVVEEGLSVFKRSNDKDTIYVVINNDDTMREASISEDIGEGNQLHGLMNDMIVRADEDGDYTFEINREAAEIFVIEEDTGINWLFISPIVAVPIIFIGFILYVSKRKKTRSAS